VLTALCLCREQQTSTDVARLWPACVGVGELVGWWVGGWVDNAHLKRLCRLVHALHVDSVVRIRPESVELPRHHSTLLHADGLIHLRVNVAMDLALASNDHLVGSVGGVGMSVSVNVSSATGLSVSVSVNVWSVTRVCPGNEVCVCVCVCVRAYNVRCAPCRHDDLADHSPATHPRPSCGSGACATPCSTEGWSTSRR
jgi:hypothetical protein